jgi:hypothetical protein
MEEYFTPAPGKIHRVFGQSQTGDTGFEFFIDPESLFERGSEMSGPRGQVQLKQVIGRKPQIETVPEKGPQDFSPVINALEQNGLDMDWKAPAD